MARLHAIAAFAFAFCALQLAEADNYAGTMDDYESSSEDVSARQLTYHAMGRCYMPCRLTTTTTTSTTTTVTTTTITTTYTGTTVTTTVTTTTTTTVTTTTV